MNRLLALPAVLCVVLAAVLGTVGWAGREESSDRAAAEDLRREVEEYMIPPVSGDYDPSADVLRIQACDALFRAATLDRTVGTGVGAVDPGMPMDPALTTLPADPTVTLPAPDAAAALVNMLDPVVVVGLPGLDEPDVLEPMARLRQEVDAAVAAGTDPFTSPVVQGAAQELGVVLATRC